VEPSSKDSIAIVAIKTVTYLPKRLLENFISIDRPDTRQHLRGIIINLNNLLCGEIIIPALKTLSTLIIIIILLLQRLMDMGQQRDLLEVEYPGYYQLCTWISRLRTQTADGVPDHT